MAERVYSYIYISVGRDWMLNAAGRGSFRVESEKACWMVSLSGSLIIAAVKCSMWLTSNACFKCVLEDRYHYMYLTVNVCFKGVSDGRYHSMYIGDITARFFSCGRFLLKMVEVLVVLLVVFIPPLWACIGIQVQCLLERRLQRVLEWLGGTGTAQFQPEAEPEPIGRLAE